MSKKASRRLDYSYDDDYYEDYGDLEQEQGDTEYVCLYIIINKHLYIYYICYMFLGGLVSTMWHSTIRIL